MLGAGAFALSYDAFPTAMLAAMLGYTAVGWAAARMAAVDDQGSDVALSCSARSMAVRAAMHWHAAMALAAAQWRQHCLGRRFRAQL